MTAMNVARARPVLVVRLSGHLGNARPHRMFHLRHGDSLAPLEAVSGQLGLLLAKLRQWR